MRTLMAIVVTPGVVMCRIFAVVCLVLVVRIHSSGRVVYVECGGWAYLSLIVETESNRPWAHAHMVIPLLAASNVRCLTMAVVSVQAQNLYNSHL